MIEGILIGLKTALTFQNILMVMIGCFFGTIIGMLCYAMPCYAFGMILGPFGDTFRVIHLC